MAEHNELGEKGEFLASRHLEEKGYEIKFRNWRFRHLEIDLIAQKSGFIIFVEVKTRSSSFMGEPEMAVTKKKQGQLINAAAAFFRETECILESRFDIVSVLITPKGDKIKHIESAFYPSLRR
jgi:putative endonuclease